MTRKQCSLQLSKMQLLHQMNILGAALAIVPLVSAASGSFKVLSYNVAGLLGKYSFPSSLHDSV
jgi:hypothetical protein